MRVGPQEVGLWAHGMWDEVVRIKGWLKAYAYVVSMKGLLEARSSPGFTLASSLAGSFLPSLCLARGKIRVLRLHLGTIHGGRDPPPGSESSCALIFCCT